MNATLRALLLGVLLFFGYGQAWGIPFQCLVGMRDGTNEKVIIDADSEQRAKEMAVRKVRPARLGHDERRVRSSRPTSPERPRRPGAKSKS